MTMPEATTAELNDAAADPLAALAMANAMLVAIGHRNDFDSLDFIMRRESIAAAMHKMMRQAQPEEPATGEGYTGETIDITPEVLKTPEGQQRVNAVMEAFTDATVELANEATQFVDTWHDLMRGSDGEMADDLTDLRAAISKRKRTQEDLLRTIANR